MADDLVVRLGARLDKFSSDMNEAGDIADGAVSKIENSFSKLNPGINIGGLTAVVAGAAAGFTALVGIVAALNKGLSDAADQAQRIGISSQRFQELQFAGSSLGVKNTGDQLEAFSQNAQVALSKVNDLKRVFDANNIALTDSNGKIKDMSKLLDSAFDIVKRAPKIGDALQVGGFLGFSKDLSQSLFNAGDGFQTLAGQAKEMGVIIDQSTIDKAKQFTQEWDKAAAVWGVSMKASIYEWLPLLNDAIGVAKTLIGIVGTIGSGIGALKEFVAPTNVDTAALDKLYQRYEEVAAIRDKLASQETRTAKALFFDPAEVKTKALDPIDLFKVAGIEQDGKLTVEALNKYLALVGDRILNFNKDPAKRIIITSDKSSVNPGVKQPEEGRDQFDAAVDQITKRTATLKADTATTFQNSAAQAQLRAEFTLLNAIVRDGGEVTQAQVDKYTDLRASMTQTQALQAAGITLTKEHAAAFDSSSAAISRATAEHVKAADQLRQINQISSQVGSALAGSFADAIVEGKALNDVLSSLLKSLAKMAINNMFSSVFNPGAGGGLSPFASLFGGGGASAGPITLGGASGPVPFLAAGTDFAPGGMAIVGEKGPELVNLPRGSQVIPNASLGKMGGDNFTFAPNIDARGADVAAVARLEQVVARQQAEFSSNVVAAVRKAKTARAL